MRGVARTVIGAIGDELTHQSLETLAMMFPQIVESVMPVQKRYKLVSREAHPTEFHGQGPRASDRRQKIPGDGRAVLGGEREAIADHGGGGERRRARRFCAAAPSSRARRLTNFRASARKGLKMLAKARKETGLAVITELLSEAARRDGGRIHRHHPDRRAQLAEFPIADRRRQDRQAGSAQARALDEDRGMAAGGRIRALATKTRT